MKINNKTPNILQKELKEVESRRKSTIKILKCLYSQRIKKTMIIEDFSLEVTGKKSIFSLPKSDIPKELREVESRRISQIETPKVTKEYVAFTPSIKKAWHTVVACIGRNTI